MTSLISDLFKCIHCGRRGLLFKIDFIFQCPKIPGQQLGPGTGCANKLWLPRSWKSSRDKIAFVLQDHFQGKSVINQAWTEQHGRDADLSSSCGHMD